MRVARTLLTLSRCGAFADQAGRSWKDARRVVGEETAFPFAPKYRSEAGVRQPALWGYIREAGYMPYATCLP